MRRLVTGDWQLCDNARDRYRTDFIINEFPKLIEKHQPDQLLILGDLTELKDNHPAPLVNEIVDIFHNLTKMCQVIFLEGNHDRLHAQHPYFRFVQKFGVIWISKPTVLERCLYLPHTRNHKKDWADVDFNGHDFIFAHNIFTGVKSNGQTLTGIPTNIFPDDAFVVAGDVHDPQTVDCVTYAGSPFLCDFGDDFQPRVLLIDDLKVKSIKVYGPQKRVVECDWSDDPQYHQPKGLYEGDIIKIKVNIDREHTASWDKIRDKVQAWGVDRGFVVNTIQPIVHYVQGDHAKVVKSERKSDKQYFESYSSRNGLDEKTIRTGQEIIDLT